MEIADIENRRTVQLLNNVGGDEPVGADANIAADEVLSKPNGKILAVIGSNQIE